MEETRKFGGELVRWESQEDDPGVCPTVPEDQFAKVTIIGHEDAPHLPRDSEHLIIRQ